jgi:hypothetical protein
MAGRVKPVIPGQGFGPKRPPTTEEVDLLGKILEGGQMTITDLVMNFPAGLLGLVPCFERVGMPWKRPEAYDEWDNCAAAAYQAVIVEPFRSTLPEAEREGFNPPGYDMLLPSYVEAPMGQARRFDRVGRDRSAEANRQNLGERIATSPAVSGGRSDRAAQAGGSTHEWAGAKSPEATDRGGRHLPFPSRSKRPAFG